MQIGLAAYGLNVWDGGSFDLEQRLADLKSIGYAGIERLEASTEADALYKAVTFRRMGMNFGTCRGPRIENTLAWTSGLGKDYVWAQVNERKDWDKYIRQVRTQAAAAKKLGLKVGVHNHLGQPVEQHDAVIRFLEQAPECGLIFDTGHHAAAGGDCMEIIERFADRIIVLHVKDWLVTDPDAGLDRWPQRGRFCELGAGNIDLDNVKLLRALVDRGFEGPVFVEHDTHVTDALAELKHSRDVLRDAGF